MNNKKHSKHTGLRISKVLLLSIMKIALPVVGGIVVFIEIFSLIEKKNIQAQEAMLNAEIPATQEEVVYVENPLLLDSVPEINVFVAEYYEALAKGDMEKVDQVNTSVSDVEMVSLEKQSLYIENYENISCYTKKGLEEDSYFVFAVTDLKFENVDTLAPSMSIFYVHKNADGQYVLEDEMSEDVLKVYEEICADTEVSDLFDKVQVSYNEAVSENEDLNNFLAELPAKLKSEVGEALAKLESPEDVSIEENEIALCSDIPEVSQGVTQVKALDTVNVRSSDSSEADKIGKVDAGQILTCLEEKINGWSKVLFEGKEAYIKSMYLETISTKAEGEILRTIKATANVNVRSEADQSSQKLGVASKGSVYNLLEVVGDWFRIDYNGNNGYVKAEYFN